MATVYRIESKNGRGPYTEKNRALLKHHNLCTDRPSPFEYYDAYGCYEFNFPFKGYVFGFNSIDALVKWFGKKERRALSKRGYHIVKYENAAFVKHGVSGKQLVFKIDKDHTTKTILFN